MTGFCSICSIPNTASNYGVNCCRACAAFFRRTLQLKLDYECRNTGKCDILHRNRYSCRKCRLNRCLELKMDKHVPRSGQFNPSSSFDGASSGEEYNVPSTCHYDNSSRSLLIDNLKYTFSQTAAEQRYFPASLCQQGIIAYREYLSKWPNRTRDKLKFSNYVDMTEATSQCFQGRLPKVAEFYMSLLPFTELSLNQKWFIFKRSWRSFLDLDRIFIGCQLLGYGINDHRVVGYNGAVLDFRNRVKFDGISDMAPESIFPLWLDTGRAKIKFASNFKRFKPDEFEVVYLMLSVIWNFAGINGIDDETLRTAEYVKSCLSEDLFTYYVYEKGWTNYAHRFYKLGLILSSLEKYATRTKCDGHTFKLFNVFKYDVFLCELR